MADIFISHQHEDRDRARLLADLLESLGFSVWWDLKMSAGEAFRDALTAMLEQSRLVIVLWSPGAAQSRFVRSEASRALQMGKLAPVLIEATELPLGLDEEHCADLSRWKGELFDPNFQALVRGLETRIGRPARLGARPPQAEPPRGRAAPTSERAARAPWRGQARMRKTGFPGWGVAAACAAALVMALAGGNLLSKRSDAADENAIVQTAGPGAAPPPQRSDRADLAMTRTSDVRSAPPSQGELLASVEDLSSQRRGAWKEARAAARERETTGAYGLLRLHPSVRRAAMGALMAATRADGAAARARVAAVRGEDAARAARAGAAGTVMEHVRNRVWATEWANGAHNGFGVLAFDEGDRYAGAWRDGRFEGPGVFAYENERGRRAGLLRYEGDFTRGVRQGAGVLYMRNGERYAGAFEGNARDGAGVYLYANGERYEGEWRGNAREGVGVLWSGSGAIQAAGIWRRGELVSSLGGEG